MPLFTPLFTFAETADQLQKAIDEHNAQIDQLNKEISQYQVQLNATSQKKQTLQGELKQIDTNLKKISASIGVTKNQIGKTKLQIQQLAGDIASKEQSINVEKSGIAESIRIVAETEMAPLIVQVLSAESVTAAWEDVDASASFQLALQQHITNLATQKDDLATAKSASEDKDAQLQSQQKTLVTQQGSLNATKKTQGEILTQTKAQESNYQKIIAEKKKQEASFESALIDLKSKLQIAIKQSDITPAGSGTLAWPLDNVIITQYFGNTPFASSGAYNGKGHNGIDLGAQIGTPLKAAASGTVLGTGNTDLVHGCYSFGKWVMIKHPNGLNTMYAHLSQINVSQGQSVSTGDVLGYSGETGYATGPHLHFGVYVSSATQIMKLGDATQSATPCAGAVMPIAPLAGYLNPMNYLPAGGFTERT